MTSGNLIDKKRSFAIALSISFVINATCSTFAMAADAAGMAKFQPIGQLAAAPATAPEDSTILQAGASKEVLQGKVSEDGNNNSPLLEGAIQVLPKGTTINLVSMVQINSETSQKGDEIWVRVAQDVPGSGGVGVPGGWFAHGIVTEAKPQRRGGRDGFVNVQFDRLISPDSKTEVPFETQFSTRDGLVRGVAKHALIDSAHMSWGAAGGALFALQTTGIPAAIASHGMTVAAGGAVGLTIGTIGAIKRFGTIRAVYPHDAVQLVIDEPVAMPGFRTEALPSAKAAAKLANMDLHVNKFAFAKDPFDSTASVIRLNLTMDNQTKKTYAFTDLCVVSDFNEYYGPSVNAVHSVTKRVAPNSSVTTDIDFGVAGKKHKYWLVLVDKQNRAELSRVPIN